LHTNELAESIAEALHKRGMSMIEILAPGPSYYRYITHLDSGLLQFYFDNSVVKNNEDPRNAPITPDEKIVVGKFTDKERATFIDSYNIQHKKILGDKFTHHGPVLDRVGGGNG
jgi:hypothetical protein